MAPNLSKREDDENKVLPKIISGEAPLVVVLSPHLDDAVFSLGGAIASCTRQAGKVTILTIFAGIPTRLPQVGRHFHDKYNLPPNIVTLRRCEDVRAASVVGAQTVHLNHLDAIYRHRDGDGSFLSMRDVLSADMNMEADLVSDVMQALTNCAAMLHADIVCVPLGIGGHIDHLITREAAERWVASKSTHHTVLQFYEDFPYVARATGDWLYDMTSGARPLLIEASEQDWKIKLQAVACFSSQISIMWSGGLSYEAEMLAYARRLPTEVQFAERVWQREIERDQEA